jgi:putative PIG3 family NAD(P)H quinone oxidoreductase
VKAVLFQGKGGPEVVTVGEVPDPAPGRGEVLVRVRAAGINRADLLQRRGLYPPPPGVREDLPGLELAGEVAGLGEGVRGWKAGDRVMAITSGEAQAELAVVHERMLTPIPEGISFEEAAAIPEAFLTAHDALFTQGGLRPGWPVLIHAAGSGVATAAVQLVQAAGGTAIGTSRTRAKLDRAQRLGLAHALLVAGDPPRFAEEVKAITGGRGVPLLLDLVGAAYLPENLAALASRGRLVAVGLLGGAQAKLDMGLLLSRRATLVGTVLRSRPLEEKIQATQDFVRDVLPLLATRAVQPVLDAAVPLARVQEAHARMEKNESFGKLVLVM